MAVEFKLPDLGENIESGDVVSVLVSVGDSLDVDQSIIELETDKAVIEVPSSVAGTITAIHVSEGDKVAVGQAILIVDAATSEAPAADLEVAPEAAAPSQAPDQQQEPAVVPAEPAVAPAAAGPRQFQLPDLGENIDGGDVVRLLVAVGDELAEDQSTLELETDKAVIEVPSSVSGRVTIVHVAEGERVSVGQPVLTIEGDVAAAPAAIDEAVEIPAPVELPVPAPNQAPAPATAAATPPATATTSATGVPPTSVPIAAAPSVRRLAREIGVDIASVAGTGPAGRISEEDVKAHSRQLHGSGGTATGTATVSLPLPDFSRWGDIERVPMSNIRRVTAERLSAAWTTIPHVTQFDKADITDLEKWRKQYGKKAEAAGGKLTPTAIILKIVASALKAFPQFNASIDVQSEEIVYKKYCHVGVAVDTDRGLLVPVVRDVDQKNIIDLAVELGEIAVKSRDKKLSPDDMQGGCFTISNLGGIGGSGFTPIVNPPEVAILGVARGAIEPVFGDGEFQPRMMLPLSLSYDHRIIDGADGARFLRWLSEALANPFLTLLEG